MIGWKALARGLSDISALGGVPRFCLLSLALPAWGDARWVDAFYDDFVDEVARSRKLDRERVDAVARGRIWSGEDALSRGLVGSRSRVTGVERP